MQGVPEIPVRSTTRSVAWESEAGGSRGRSAAHFFPVEFEFPPFGELLFSSTSTSFFFSSRLSPKPRKLTRDVPGLEARERRATVPLRRLEVLALGELHQLAAEVREPPVFEFCSGRTKKKMSCLFFATSKDSKPGEAAASATTNATTAMTTDVGASNDGAPSRKKLAHQRGGRSRRQRKWKKGGKTSLPYPTSQSPASSHPPRERHHTQNSHRGSARHDLWHSSPVKVMCEAAARSTAFLTFGSFFALKAAKSYSGGCSSPLAASSGGVCGFLASICSRGEPFRAPAAAAAALRAKRQ